MLAIQFYILAASALCGLVAFLCFAIGMRKQVLPLFVEQINLAHHNNEASHEWAMAIGFQNMRDLEKQNTAIQHLHDTAEKHQKMLKHMAKMRAAKAAKKAPAAKPALKVKKAS